ncbi:MAG: hypothetical protein WDO24_29510 [Pseudomonadota bacterium]
MIGGAGLAIVVATSLSGCVGIAIGGAASVGVAASEERGVGGALTDTRIRTDINAACSTARRTCCRRSICRSARAACI